MNRRRVWLAGLVLLAGCGVDDAQRTDEHQHEEHTAAPTAERGPHGGHLLRRDEFALELVIHQSGVTSEYRAWLYEEGAPLQPDAATMTVELQRLGGAREHFTFVPQRDYLRSTSVVAEPHSFDVTVHVAWEGESFEWKFESYSGRTSITSEMARTMGIVTMQAGPARLEQRLALSGAVQADPARVSRVRARYPGVVRAVPARPWTTVARGAVLAQVQSNESLQNYAVAAPISGVIVEHRAQVGEATGEQALFTIIDLSHVWVELDVFQNDLGRIAEDQSVAVLDLDGRKLADGRIERVAPLAVHGSQSVRARVILDNASGVLRPGQFVTGQVTVGDWHVPLAVEAAALQRLGDADVVFEQVGDIYEARVLRLGRADAERVEVLGGLEDGARYVTGNSYLIKADIEKAGAGHDH